MDLIENRISSLLSDSSSSCRIGPLRIFEQSRGCVHHVRGRLTWAGRCHHVFARHCREFLIQEENAYGSDTNTGHMCSRTVTVRFAR
jgi:hypothetical protein